MPKTLRPLPSSDTFTGLQNQGGDYETHLMFCISTYLIVLCCSVFLHIQLFSVPYSYTFNHFMLFCIPTYSIASCSISLQIKSFNVLHLYILNRIMLLCIPTYCSVFLHLKLFDFVLYLSLIEFLRIKYI
jgi:hypothetical protein